MSIKETFSKFKTTVDSSGSTVVSFCNFMAVFGGPVSRRFPVTRPKSNRDAFLSLICSSRPDLYTSLLLPEKYTSWPDFNTYSDLLLFEKDLGFLTSAVVIFLERPGAIAEFAAFSQIESLRKRLLVVISREHYEAKSFISLGPVRSVEHTNDQPDSICVIPKILPGELANHADVIFDSLDILRRRSTASEKFRADNEQHQMLLVLDLINLFRTVQIEEIQDLCNFFGCSLDLRRMSQLLFVLIQVDLVAKVSYGKSKFYVPLTNHDYLSYKGDSKRFNKLALKAESVTKIESDFHRKSAYQQGIALARRP